MSLTLYKTELKIGEGIYSVPEAAQILKIPLPKVERWIKNYWEYNFTGIKEVSNPYTSSKSRDKAFNFYTLMEIIVVYTLREVGVSFQKIKLAHGKLSELLDTAYPFSTSPLLTDGSSIFYKYDETALLNLDKSMQTSFKKIIAPYCKKIDFDKSNRLAQRYWPLGKSHNIVVDPHHGFGKPTISGTNITVASLLTLLRAGEKKEFVAALYNISLQSVKDIILYEIDRAA